MLIDVLESQHMSWGDRACGLPHLGISCAVVFLGHACQLLESLTHRCVAFAIDVLESPHMSWGDRAWGFPRLGISCPVVFLGHTCQALESQRIDVLTQ
jgi:hypothetical protein